MSGVREYQTNVKNCIQTLKAFFGVKRFTYTQEGYNFEVKLPIPYFDPLKLFVIQYDGVNMDHLYVRYFTPYTHQITYDGQQHIQFSDQAQLNQAIFKLCVMGITRAYNYPQVRNYLAHILKQNPNSEFKDVIEAMYTNELIDRSWMAKLSWHALDKLVDVLLYHNTATS